ncbi:MAG TPA: glutamate--tRNA ligase [Acidimicrobiales bacterium]|nr:glutamate--tRNA ligase [Acidimicrobiales bacterium]
MAGPVRTRFSPSPTGYLHVGGGRSVLYNWFLARQSPEGVLILRIEDTDRERHGEEHVDGIRRAIKWLGLDWDEEYRQSERTELYAAATARLLAQGDAYYCACTREAIDARKAPGAPQGGYDRFCRDRGLPPDGNALRFRVPAGKTVIDDKVRGTVEFDNDNIQDFVIQRADRSALFILANVVDDIDMRITHVIRGEEHLPNTAPYQLLWAALGGDELPTFAHLSVIVDEKRRKISKRRDGELVMLERYALDGYLPAAMRNYLALLGWSPSGNREIVPLEEMLREFRLEDVNASSAFFDVKKLRAFNGEYIRALSVDEFVAACEPWANLAPYRELAPEVQTRIEVLAEVPDLIDWLPAPVAVLAAWPDTSTPMLDGCIAAFADCDWTHDGIKAAIESVGEAHGLKLGKAQAPIRLAVMGKPHGLPITSIATLPRDEVLRRLTAARNTL